MEHNHCSAASRSKQLLPGNEGVSDKRFLSSKEAALFLNMSLNQFYKLSSSGCITTYKPTGKKLYCLREDLEEWVLSGKRATIKSITENATKIVNLKSVIYG